MKNMRRSLWAALALLLVVSLATPVFAQSITATITGTVEDKSGAILKDASILAANQKTGVEYPTKSNDSGIFTITGLPIGAYVVKAEAAGMKTLVTNPITLEVGQTARVNLKLEVGAKAEEIEVVGVNPVLQTENAVVGEVITGATAVALPLNGRNFAQLTLLTPGAQHHDPQSFTVPGGVSGGRPYVNGHREQGNNFMLDGIDMNEAMDNLIAYNPSPDALAEIRVETNNYSAEFGNVAGAVVSSVMKSGSNEFHGNLFEFMRNDKFDANSWDLNRVGAEKAELKQHIFGGTLGGPLMKNKVFFFMDYQGTRVSQPGGASIKTVPASLRAQATSPIAQKLYADVAKYPLPNSPDGVTFNGTRERTTKNHQGDFKIDANLSPKDNVFARLSLSDFEAGDDKTVIPLVMGVTSKKPAISAAFNWTRAFSPTAVNELRVGYSRVKIDEVFDDVNGLGNYNATLGIPGGQGFPGMSSLVFGTVADNIGSAANNSTGKDVVLQLGEKFSFSTGRHFVSIGGQLLNYTMDRRYEGNNGLNGVFTFASIEAFNAGTTSNKAISGGAPWQHKQNRIGFFIQDDIKANANLTLNAGVRWEYSSPLVEANDKQVNYNLTTGQALFAGAIPAGACAGHAPGCVTDSRRGLYNSYKGGFSPRVGFAWTANAKTVVRGGYGIVQYMEGTGANNRLTQNVPFVPVDRTLSNPSNISLGFSDTIGGAAGTVAQGQIRAFAQDLKPQLTHQWNVFVERQITDATSLSVGYVGHRASRVAAFHDANQPNPGVGDPSTWTPNEERRPLKALMPNVSNIRLTDSDAHSEYNGLQVSLRGRRSKGLEFLASYTFSKSVQDNAGFYGAGWGGTANFTLHGKGGDGDQDYSNIEADKGPSFFDTKHNFVLSANYELPIGKGRSKELGGVANAILGGWNISTIATVHSGFPVTVVDGWNVRSLQHAFTQERPDRIGDGQASGFDWSVPGSQYLDPSAFRQVALGTFGNSGVGILRGPGYYNLDLGIDKEFSMGGARALILRIEAFNVLNHANKGMPNNNFSDPASATNPGGFGTITYSDSSPRILEFAAKFRF